MHCMYVRYMDVIVCEKERLFAISVGMNKNCERLSSHKSHIFGDIWDDIEEMGGSHSVIRIMNYWSIEARKKWYIFLTMCTFIFIFFSCVKILLFRSMWTYNHHVNNKMYKKIVHQEEEIDRKK